MSQKKHSLFKKILSTVLSTACLLSTAAVTGAAASTVSAAPVSAAAVSGDPSAFSWDNATVYFLLTDRFYNGDKSNDNAYGRQDANVGDQRATFHGGDFAGITQKIKEGYFDDLGVNAIWLSAPYEQIHGYIQGGDDFYHYSYHGYYVLDYTETDDAYGTKEEFKNLVDTAHEHGIRIIMDIVMNHAGYCSMYDMNEYGFGALNSGWETFYQNPPSNAQQYQNYMNYKEQADSWAKWWGNDWIRSDIAGYTDGQGGSELTQCISGLPDFRTESTKQVSLPPLLVNKWTKEGTLAEKQSKYGTSNTVTGYLTTWLSEWVREYGVDGFRCDTAKHVEKTSWKKLKDACVEALREWKSKNPDKKLDDLDFWMTGEHWDHKVYKDDYYTVGGFDSMINFDMTGGAALAKDRVSGKYNDYANAINNDDSFNVLSFISSHDETLARGDMYYIGSAFLMLPGAVQIFYGDETNRGFVSGVPQDGYGGAGHSLRSDMNWDSYDPELLDHWGKVGRFRSSHIAVGAGANTTLTASNGVAFGRTYSKNGINDKVAGVIGASEGTDVSVDVSDIWADGTVLENAYDDSVSAVTSGKVTFNSGNHGTILIQEPSGQRGRVTVIHKNSETGEVIKTETLVGLIGEKYSTSSLEELSDYYTVTKVTGDKTGVYSENDVTVTYYYKFDSANNGIIKVSYVDAATGAAIADPDTKYGKIGSKYSVEPKSVKNYEVDESKTTNASGTVKSGTTNVVFKYNYVEPANVQVHYYNSNSWQNVNMYVYDDSDKSNVIEYTVGWPGDTMTSEGDGWFFGEVDAENALFIANAGYDGPQDPAGKETSGYDVAGEVWIKSGKVYPTGKVNVRYVTSDGKVLATEVIKGMVDGVNEYKTNSRSFDGYKLVSTPSNASGKFTENTITVTYTYSGGTPVETPLTNKSTVSATTVTVGDTFKVNGAATGGTAPYRYYYYYKKSSAAEWNEKLINTTATSVTMKPTAAGKYDIGVYIKDSKGKTCKKTITITVNSAPAELVNKSTVSATTVTVGDTFKVNGAATGGTAPYKYYYYYKKSSATEWNEKLINTTATSVTMKPTAAGTYDIGVYIKDSKGQTCKKTLKVTVTAALTNKSTVSATTVTVGDTFKVNGAATGGTAPYKYYYYYKKSSAAEWNEKLINTTATSVTMKPTAAGTYDIGVYIKDSKGKTCKKTMTVTVKSAPAELVNKSTVSATTVTLGNTFKVNGAATGGTAPYKYYYYYKKSSATKWSEKLINTTATSVTMKPTAAGTYDIGVYIKDSKGQTCKKTITVTVKAALINNSKVSATSVKLGNSFKVTGAASGGTAPYTYSYYYKKSSATSWTAKATNTTAASVTMKPVAKGTYDIRIVVKDSKNATADIIYTVTVN